MWRFSGEERLPAGSHQPQERESAGWSAGRGAGPSRRVGRRGRGRQVWDSCDGPGVGDWRHRLEAEREGVGASREHVCSGYRAEGKEGKTRQSLTRGPETGDCRRLLWEQEGRIRAAARLPGCPGLGSSCSPLEALGPRWQAHPIPLRGPVSATHTPSLPSQALALV